MSFSTLSPASALRPTSVLTAIALLVIAAVGSFVASLFFYDDFGAGFLAVSALMAVIRFTAATGMLNRHRWAAVLGAAITLIDMLLTAPLFFDNPSTGLQVVGAIGLVIDVITLVLIVLPASRRSYI